MTLLHRRLKLTNRKCQAVPVHSQLGGFSLAKEDGAEELAGRLGPCPAVTGAAPRVEVHLKAELVLLGNPLSDTAE